MGAKGVTAVVAFGIVAGAIGFIWGTSRQTSQAPPRRAETHAHRGFDEDVRGPDRPAPAPTESGEGSGTNAPEPLPAEADPRRKGPETDEEKRARYRKAADAYRDALQIPRAVEEVAERMGVDERFIKSVMMAEWSLHAERVFPGDVQREGAQAALRELTDYGETGFLAVLAMIRGSPFGTYYKRLVKATWQPGREQRLFDAIDETIRSGATPFAALASLGVADTDDVRRFLRDRLKRHRNHASLFTASAAALGDLGDTESAAKVAANLKRAGWSGMRSTLLTALGGMGGEDARRALIDYVSWEHATVESSAVQALALIDPALARAEAEALLAGRHKNKLDAVQRPLVQRFVDGAR